MTTEHQKRALRELRAISQTGSRALAVLGDAESLGAEPGKPLTVPVRISTAGMRRYPGGLPIGDNEDLEVRIPAGYPTFPPTLHTTDYRFDVNPHVFWNDLCLYINEDRQWVPSDGMYGFVEQISEWLADAAAGRLDPDGGPVHPYLPLNFDLSGTQLVVRGEVPDGDNKRLLWAEIERSGDNRADLVRFRGAEPDDSVPVAAAVLSDRPISENHEWKFGRLLFQLEDLGFEGRMIVKHLRDACLHNPPGAPLLVVVGTLNRGTSSSRRYHLVAWELPAGLADKFRVLNDLAIDGEQAENARESIIRWWDDEPLQWAEVHEARPSVTVRRDQSTPMGAFKGKSVEIWGCGALGAWLAEMIARAGAARLVLWDRGRVGPGLIARQPYEEPQVTRKKAKALKERLERVAPHPIKIEAHPKSVLNSDGTVVGLSGTDLLIDATASRKVAAALERHIARTPNTPAVVSVLVDARCSTTAMFASPPEGAAGPTYTARRAVERLARTHGTAHFEEAFWDGDSAESLVQPEPGCSAPTFHGSAADAAAAAGTLANQIGRFLADPGAHTAEFCVLSHCEQQPGRQHFRCVEPAPTAVAADGGYTVLISEAARQAINQAASDSFGTAPEPETGGELYGERDDASMTVTVDAAFGPPPDSIKEPTKFVRGMDGTAERSQAFELGSPHLRAGYLGDWHAHPHGTPQMSQTDLDTAAEKAQQEGASLVVVWAGTPDKPRWAAKVTQPDLTAPTTPEEARGAAPAVEPSQTYPVQPTASPKPCRHPMPPRTPLHAVSPGRTSIMVALSGGGFRATLTALGALRLLADSGLLPDVRIFSSVSGGSLANAATAAHWDKAQTQPAFDELVLRPVLEGITGSSFQGDLLKNAWRALLPGKNLADVLADRLDRRFLHGRELEDLAAGCWFMFNATNATEGVRFRFDADVAGDYVNGSIPTQGTGLRLATAVAASAAVPGCFPPLDVKHLGFPCNTGNPVELVDGGVYDNLALESVMRRERENDGLGDALVISVDAGAILDRGSRRGMGRLPIAGRLWRANSIMHRQNSSLRVRQMFRQQESGGRPCTNFNLTSSFDGAELDDAQSKRLAQWREINEEHSEAQRTQLSSIPTAFSRLSEADAVALVQRGWWLCGATLFVYHPHYLSGPPRWSDLTVERGVQGPTVHSTGPMQFRSP
ncbi:MAG: patatin-like phospholipase family protein [Acidimicrobiia bacterium]|nr:patatin-like phospholipase family protein [Acidimicrobiia bacterium]MCY4434649.1 patatin-like phospholipase family protein [bacterium]